MTTLETTSFKGLRISKGGTVSSYRDDTLVIQHLAEAVHGDRRSMVPVITHWKHGNMNGVTGLDSKVFSALCKAHPEVNFSKVLKQRNPGMPSEGVAIFKLNRDGERRDRAIIQPR